MRWLASELASELPGALVGPDVDVDGATIDSRLVRGGELFVPIVAERDGHDFIPDALERGAAAYMTSGPPAVSTGAGSAVVVADTVEALAAVGRLARDRLPDRVVGITGSTGKTSTKDLLGAVMRAQGPCAVSERNYNNELGVPLTLANAPAGAQAAVVELGARGPGHIRYLCEIARPTVGIVTNVAMAHTEFLGTLDGVAAAKSELPASLPASGTAVLNASDERVAAMAAVTPATVLTYGIDAGEVRAAKVRLDGELRPAFTLETPWGVADVELAGARGAHQAANAAGAAAAALVLGVELNEIAASLSGAQLSPWRLEVMRTPAGVVVLNDVYNANPSSAVAALEALAAVPVGGRRLAVLGPMLELGERSATEHRRVAEAAAGLGIEVLAFGTGEYGLEPFDSVDTVLNQLHDNDAVLVKGSRGAHLERVVEALMAGGGVGPW